MATRNYILPDEDANYLSMYGAMENSTAGQSIEAAYAGNENALSVYNLNEHDSFNSIGGMKRTSLFEQEDLATTIRTYQSVEDTLFELFYRRKSSVHGTHSTQGQSPIYRAIFNMLAGAGVIGLPVTYRNSGLGMGICMMVIVAILSVYTLRLLIQTGKKVKCEDYERLVSHCFGVWGYYFISFSILIFDIGACLTYTIILGNSARDVMSYLFGGFWGTFRSRQIVICLIYICLILPFCLGKNFEFIEKVSALAIFVVVLMIFVVIYEYFDEYQFDKNVDVTPWISNDYIQIVAALGTISFAFIQHDLAFLVYKTLKNNTLRRYTILSILGMTIQCILCSIMAIFGYLSFGSETNDDILTNYAIGNVLVLGVRILYTFRMAFVFPTAFYVVRHILYAIIFRGMETYEHASRQKQIIFTLIPWSLFLCVGLFVDDLGFVMSFAGLLSALNIAFVLPSLCHLKVGTKHSIAFWMAPKGERCNAFCETFPSLILILFGILVGVTGSIGLFLQQFDFL